RGDQGADRFLTAKDIAIPEGSRGASYGKDAVTSRDSCGVRPGQPPQRPRGDPPAAGEARPRRRPDARVARGVEERERGLEPGRRFILVRPVRLAPTAIRRDKRQPFISKGPVQKPSASGG